MKYLYILILFTFVLNSCRVRKSMDRVYVYQEDFFFTSVKTNYNNEVSYRIFTEMVGAENFTGKYTIHKDTLHLAIDLPVVKKFDPKVEFIPSADTIKNIQFIDEQNLPWPGASVSVNDHIKLLADTNGRVFLPKNLSVNKVIVHFPGIRDTLFQITQSYKGNIRLTVPSEQYTPVIYSFIIENWLIRHNRLYPLENKNRRKTFFLTRR